MVSVQIWWLYGYGRLYGYGVCMDVVSGYGRLNGYDVYGYGRLCDGPGGSTHK